LFKGIRVGSFPQFAENVHPLLRAHLCAGQRVRRIGLVEAVEDSDDFLHPLILPLSAKTVVVSRQSRGPIRHASQMTQAGKCTSNVLWRAFYVPVIPEEEIQHEG
jgi:hypothetical protein